MNKRKEKDNNNRCPSYTYRDNEMMRPTINDNVCNECNSNRDTLNSTCDENYHECDCDKTFLELKSKQNTNIKKN